MARTTIGAWIRQGLGGPKTGTASPRSGNQLLTHEGAVAGTIIAVWQHADATDHAQHEDTLCIQRPVQDEARLLCIPASAIERRCDQGLVLTLAATQVTVQSWRFRPMWLPQNDPGEVVMGTNRWQSLKLTPRD